MVVVFALHIVLGDMLQEDDGRDVLVRALESPDVVTKSVYSGGSSGVDEGDGASGGRVVSSEGVENR